MKFEELRLHPALLAAVQHVGYRQPTPSRPWPSPTSSRRDLLGCAQDGAGKTAAFVLPVLHRLAAAPGRGRQPRALVLAPTRELVIQVSESFALYGGRRLDARCAAVHGGAGPGAQAAALGGGVDILVATPGRLLDLFDQHLLELHSVEMLVLDEADRMLDMGFIKPIRQISAALPARRQTAIFSATLPAAVRGLAGTILRSPAQVSVATDAPAAARVEQQVYFVRQAEKTDLLAEVLSRSEAERVIVFTRTKHGADKVARTLVRSSIDAAVLHGSKSRNARLQVLSNFKSGQVRVLVATDMAARGLDVDGISHVVNYDMPSEPESYVDRIGRTGRAGAAGLALSFCADAERGLLRDIERLTREPMTVLRGQTSGPGPHLAG